MNVNDLTLPELGLDQKVSVPGCMPRREMGHTPIERRLPPTVETVTEDDDAGANHGSGQGLDELLEGAGRETSEIVVHC